VKTLKKKLLSGTFLISNFHLNGYFFREDLTGEEGQEKGGSKL
jgi:hypothetical protein